MSLAPERRPSLADSAEEALRAWLVPGRHRPGDRLPPEHDLAAMLGVSRGTLRTALQRLEASGEIVRRQGSGTFVARVARTPAFDEGLERLEPYSSLARRRGVVLTVRNLSIAQRPAAPAVAAALDLQPDEPAPTVSRVVLADGVPAAFMEDVVHPSIELPPVARIERELRRGGMMLDLLMAAGITIAFARTHVQPRLVGPEDPEARALALEWPTALLELEEVMHLSSGEPAQHSRDLFAPGGIDLHVIRRLAAGPPSPVSVTIRRPAGRTGRPPRGGPR